MNVCVFCSANDVEEKYVSAARELGGLIGREDHTLIWGGSDSGLMKVVASGVQNSGGKIVGISMEVLRHKARANADEMIITKTLGERKALMIERADAIVVLVGGIGTLDEVTEVLELKKHGLHHKPVAILNTDHFYDGLKTQLKKMDEEGFLPARIDDLLHFADTPEEVMEYIADQS